jgi:hypothetical protein
MTRRSTCFLILAGLTGLGASSLQAKDSGCTNADFAGVFSMQLSGVVLPGLPISGDFARLGTVVADGLGNTTVTSIADYDGHFSEEDFPGTYTVADNCAVTWDVTIPTGPLNPTGPLDAVFSGVIFNTDQNLSIYVSGPAGSIIFGSLEKQQTGCNLASLNGGFALDLNGHIVEGDPITGPFGRVGQIVFDGAGNAVVTNSIVSYSGAMLREIYLGTYTIDTACHMVWHSVLPYPVSLSVTIEGILSADGTHAYLLWTSPVGAVVPGEMNLQ